MTPFLPPLVPFGSKQWPTLITPGAGTARAHRRPDSGNGSVRARSRIPLLHRGRELDEPEHDHRGEAPASADEITALARWLRVARRRHLAVLGAAAELDTLIDLESLGWPALQASADGLDIAATCRIAELDRFAGAARVDRGAAFRECCRSFLASFKIWNAATVGGNICMSLPAGPMISLTVALEGVYTLWPRGAAPRKVAGRRLRDRQPRERPAAGRIAAQHHLPPRRSKRVRLPPRLAHAPRALGGAADRHAAPEAGDVLLTVTAATPRPVQLALRARAVRRRAAPRARRARSPTTAISTTCTARRRTAAT